MATVTLNALTAACLASGALTHLWDVVCAQGAEGCCPVCCHQCRAVLLLDDEGHLDKLIRPFVGLFRQQLWTDDGTADRTLMARAWARRCEVCDWPGMPLPGTAIPAA